MNALLTALWALTLFTGTWALGLWLLRFWSRLPVGTKSVLCGSHAFWLHPWFVALAWTRLYGFPTDPRLWLAFVVHDLGYWGRPNMDGPEGEQHPRFGAKVLHRFDREFYPPWKRTPWFVRLCDRVWGRSWELWEMNWWAFVMFHSRFLAKRYDAPFSKLCVADKLALALTPWWVYVPMSTLSGEIHEYMAPDHHEDGGKYEGEGYRFEADPRTWWSDVQQHMREWVRDHKDGQEDEVTLAGVPEGEESVDGLETAP